jgi:HAD superfamily hydrolase (TIGR01509 family)
VSGGNGQGARRLRGVLLDIDGTLLDSNDAHARAWVEALHDVGRDIAFEQVRPLIGMGGDKVIPALTGHGEDHPEAQRAVERKKAHFDRLLPTLQPFPGARALLERLRTEGLLLIVATSAGGEEVARLLEQAGVADLVHDETTKGDVESSKPDPDIVHAALRKGGLRADEVMMIGDTPYDIAAARQAGVPTVAVRCGGWWDDRALGGAVARYDDPAALLREFDASPLAVR